METILFTPPNPAQIPEKNDRLVRSLLMAFLTWHNPYSSLTPFEMAAIVMEIVAKFRGNEIGLIKPYKEFSVAFSHRHPHEVAIKMYVNHNYSNEVYFNLEEDDSCLRTYLMILTGLKSEATFLQGTIKTLRQKIRMELLVSQTISLLKQCQRRFSESEEANRFTENIY